MTYYHIDRSGNLHEGKIIELNRDFIPNNADGEFLINRLFQKGVSKHGEHYLSDTIYQFNLNMPIFNEIFNSNAQNSTFFAEYTFELVRRLFFSNKSSRFTSLFALKNYDDLKFWPEIVSNNYRVFEINTADEYNVFDANFLKGGLCFSKSCLYQGFSSSINFRQAFYYWSGEKSNSPKPEVLLPLPVKIGRQII